MKQIIKEGVVATAVGFLDDKVFIEYSDGQTIMIDYDNIAESIHNLKPVCNITESSTLAAMEQIIKVMNREKKLNELGI